MRLAGKLRQLLRIRAVLKSRATSSVKRSLWNKEFADGRWDYIDNTPDDCIYPYLEKYCKGGSLLDLGCGSGNTGNELAIDKYNFYWGVDIADVAVQKAIERSKANGRSSKNRYSQGDIYSYEPTRKYDVILFRESIWYIPESKIQSMLDRYRGHLEEDGVFVVRICDQELHGAIVKLIDDNYELLEKHTPDGATTIVLVFR